MTSYFSALPKLVPIVHSLVIVSRIIQCAEDAYRARYKFIFIMNVLKYVLALVIILVATFCSQLSYPTNFISWTTGTWIWLILCIILAIWSAVWDCYWDWGLLTRGVKTCP